MSSAIIYSTSKCNLQCKHCAVGADQDYPRQQQSTEEMTRILDQLAEKNVDAVTILGGEATIYRSDLGKILDHASRVDIKVSINTNLTSYKVVEPLIEKPALRSFIVSLDGARLETHDAIRGKGTFKRTTENVKKITTHRRVKSRQLLVQIAFIISQVNYAEAANMLYLAKSLGATHLNVKNVKITGRAQEFAEHLRLDYRELLSAYSLLIVNWMLVKGIELEVFVPPAFAVYLNKGFNLDFPTTEHHACGGRDVFTYVDLRGNHLPCPAMAYEQNCNEDMNAKLKEVNLLQNDMTTSLASPMFRNFEERRKSQAYTTQMYPCRYCRFNKQCIPCVAEVIEGKLGSNVDICSAVFDHGAERVPGIRDEIWASTPVDELLSMPLNAKQPVSGRIGV